MSAPFPGFTSKETFAQIPDSLLLLMREMDDVAELKVTLFAVWRIERIEGNFRALCQSDFAPDALGLSAEDIERGLKKAVARGTLLAASRESDVFYFLNSPRGRLAAEAFAQGQWRQVGKIFAPPRSNLFKLYEEHIGALTPLVADMLREAEKEYPAEWFQEAFEIAVSRNVRHWRYVEAILKRWKENGKDERKNQPDPAENTRRYAEGEFSEFINRD